MADHNAESGANPCYCGHAVWWHHDTRGCGYLGFSQAHRCSCRLLAHEAVETVVSAAKAQAWDQALEHVWELNDPAYTILTDTESIHPLLTRADIEQAKGENPHRTPPESLTGGPE